MPKRFSGAQSDNLQKNYYNRSNKSLQWKCIVKALKLVRRFFIFTCSFLFLRIIYTYTYAKMFGSLKRNERRRTKPPSLPLLTLFVLHCNLSSFIYEIVKCSYSKDKVKQLNTFVYVCALGFLCRVDVAMLLNFRKRNFKYSPNFILSWNMLVMKILILCTVTCIRAQFK